VLKVCVVVGPIYFFDRVLVECCPYIQCRTIYLAFEDQTAAQAGRPVCSAFYVG